ncbi:MAG: putative porin [Maribacter sp.]|nr:putative porin [Maribacter sp.]
MKYFFLLLLIISCPILHAQVNPVSPAKNKGVPKPQNDQRRRVLPKTEDVVIDIKEYKIISFARDTTYLDTTLTIQKEYKYNYLRKDDFELMPFSNVGQPYNKLGVDFERSHLYPLMGAKAKHYNYFEVEDIEYYHVPTPMTDLFFKTTFEQGQLLDALLTFNTSPRFNFSIAFKGFRSLGKYQLDQSQSGNFRSTANYISENGRYGLRSHIAAQDILTEENGGLISKEEQFESGDPDYTDRSRIDTRLTGTDIANNKILGKRYFLEHHYKLLRTRKDSSIVEKTSLAIGHSFNYETKYYQYKQNTPSDYFGSVFVSPINDKASLKTMYNEFNMQFYNATLGKLQGSISLYNYNYYFNSLLVTADGQSIQSQLKGEEISLGAKYLKTIGGFVVKGSGKYNLSGDLTTSILDASTSYRFNDKIKIDFSLHSSARMPDFNFLLYQSEYENYNWQNTASFENQKVNSLQFNLDSKIWGSLSTKYTNIDNYTYFAVDPNQQLVEGQEQATIKPFQESNSVGHLKVKYAKEFKLGGFALNNTLMYQNVSQTSEVLNVPQLVTRNTLYFSSDVFNKAMYLQTGVTFKYFTSYTMDAYNPVLGEFYIQDSEKLGGFPMLDFFINAKIQQTRVYLKAEHFNSSFSGYNFYSAPNYPYRDFVIRFGLVWNFFS